MNDPAIPVPEIVITAELTSKSSAILTAKLCDRILAFDTLNPFKSITRERFLDKIVEEFPDANRTAIRAQMIKIASDLRYDAHGNATSKSQSQPQDALTRSGADRMINFLQTFKPSHSTKNGSIFFADLNQAVKRSDLHTLPGAIDIVRQTNEWIRERGQRDIKPTAELRLLKDLMNIAGARLFINLPKESAEHRADVLEEQIRDALVNLLTVPRFLDSGAGEHLSFAGWATRLAPSIQQWRQCYGQQVYVKTARDTIRMAIRSEYFYGQMQILKREFQSAAASAPFLYKHKLLVKSGEGSTVISNNNRQLRVWEIHADIVLEACGTPTETAPTNSATSDDSTDPYAKWTDDHEEIPHE